VELEKSFAVSPVPERVHHTGAEAVAVHHDGIG